MRSSKRHRLSVIGARRVRVVIEVIYNKEKTMLVLFGSLDQGLLWKTITDRKETALALSPVTRKERVLNCVFFMIYSYGTDLSF